jgi:alpha-galactosidase
MNRRNFLHLTGCSLGSLIISRYEGNLPEEKMAMPDELSVRVGNSMQRMQRSSAGEWRYRDIVVRVIHSKDALQFMLQAPQSAVAEIEAAWQYAKTSTGMVLGDHWERTYGDVHFQPTGQSKRMPWYFIQVDSKSVNCFGVKTGAASICSWQVSNGQMLLTMNTRSAGVGVELGERALKAAEVVFLKSSLSKSVFAIARQFCGIMCDTPRLPAQPVYGINDWYFTYGKNSAELIHQHTAMLADLATSVENKPVSVIDAGWAAYSPLLPDDCCWQEDFSRPNDHFKDMAKVAADIKQLGMQPGLWTRPLCAKHDDKPTLLLPKIKGRDDARKPILDPTIDEVIARVKHNVSLYREWGFNLVKHDFTTYDIYGRWGFDMGKQMTEEGWRFSKSNRTTAEVVLDLYRSIREAAGHMNVIGCNTFSHLSAGLFELNRIGDDTSGKEWERTRKMGVNTLGFRLIQDKKFYSCDGDCVGITTAVPWKQNAQWLELLAQSGTPLFISVQPEALGAEQKKAIREGFSNAAKVQPTGEPLDWQVNQWPTKWRLNQQVRNFDWS